MSPEPDARRLAEAAIRELEKLADPERAVRARAYFKTHDRVQFFGVSASEVRRLAARIRRECPAWRLVDAVRFASALGARPELEAKTLGFCVLGRYRPLFDDSVLLASRRWLGASCHDWASTDTLCAEVVGPLLVDRPQLIRGLRPWRSSPALYLRRASAVALVTTARRGIALEEAYATADALAGDRQDLIQKATGWLLREAGKTDPTRLASFLRRSGHRFSRTTIRYAIERFPPELRKALMERTKARSGA